jgi:putative transposase
LSVNGVVGFTDRKKIQQEQALYQGTTSVVPPTSQEELGFNPCMTIPARNASSEDTLSSSRIFFATTKTSMGRSLLQSERNAVLLVDVLRACVVERRFLLHDFVIMPDHVHLLMTVHEDMTIEKAMQLIKGRFSYRLRREFQYLGEVWQRGFSEARADDQESFLRYQEYIAQNPVKAGLADSPEQYPYCYSYLAKKKRARV